MDMKYGKKGKRRSGRSTGKVQKGGGLSGTPEQIHEKMWPKFEKMDKEGRQSEIDAAQRVIQAWDKKQQEMQAQARSKGKRSK